MPSPGDVAATPTGSPGLRRVVLAAAVLGALGVALGAFGAHGLRPRVTPARLETFETAVRYHLIHAVALLALAGLAGRGVPGRTATRIAGLWIAGTLVFSGSLYALVLLDLPILGAVTPIGGILYISGWIWLAVAAVRSPLEHPDAERGPSPHGGDGPPSS